jgi:hypothetical protein
VSAGDEAAELEQRRRSGTYAPRKQTILAEERASTPASASAFGESARPGSPSAARHELGLRGREFSARGLM